MSPMVGDGPCGVVARRTCPSGVASFGRVTHAPANPRALYKAIRRSPLHQSRAAPRSPKVGSWMLGRAGERRVASCSSWTRSLTCPLSCCSSTGGRCPCCAGARRCRRCGSCGFVIMQRHVVSPTVEVPQIQFIAPTEDIPVASRSSTSLSWCSPLVQKTIEILPLTR